MAPFLAIRETSWTQKWALGSLSTLKQSIDQWLADDKRQLYNQHHTAQRVYDRLCEADPACAVSYSTVRCYVQTQRQTVPTTGTLALHWHPGEAQVDFGHVDAYERGILTRVHMLCVSFPYSNAAYVQLFRGEKPPNAQSRD